MPDVAFEYKKLFKGAKLEEVFDATLEWLREKGAKVGRTERPTMIESVYGRKDAEYNWDRELKRTIDFEFVTTELYVGVGVWQSPVRATVKRVLESPGQANITWKDWIDECWTFVAAKAAPAAEPKKPAMRVPAAKTPARPGAKAPPEKKAEAKKPSE